MVAKKNRDDLDKTIVDFYKGAKDATILKSMMGHASIETTYRHYVRNNRTKEETSREVEQALQGSVTPSWKN